jgi:drug/metabolite transporter (DMT)-like permease
MNTFTKATLFAFGAAVISGINGFFTKTALVAVGDPVLFTFLKNIVTVAILLGAFFLFGKAREIREASMHDRWMLLAIGIVGGGIPFLLYFTGLSMIPAVTAAFIHKTLFLWVAILAIPFLGERVGWLHAFSFGLLFLAIVLFQLPVFKTFGTGEMLVLLATLLWAVENIIAKKVLHRISSLSASSARMSIGSVVIFAFVLFGGKAEMMLSLSLVAWGWVFLTGILLTGFVSVWYRALSLAPVTFVTCLLIPATFITGALSSLLVTHTVSVAQVVGWMCLVAGITLLFLGSSFAAPKRQLRSVAVDSLV